MTDTAYGTAKPVISETGAHVLTLSPAEVYMLGLGVANRLPDALATPDTPLGQAVAGALATSLFELDGYDPEAVQVLYNNDGVLAWIALEDYLKLVDGFDAEATQTLKNVNGTISWVTDE